MDIGWIGEGKGDVVVLEDWEDTFESGLRVEHGIVCGG